MNYIRSKQKNISLASIDFENNALDYAFFNKKNESKNLEDLKSELNNYSANNYFAIIENGTNKLVGIVGFKNLIQSNQRSNIDLILSEKLDKEKSIKYGSEALKGISDYAYDVINLHSLLCEDSDINLSSMYENAGYQYIGTRHSCLLKEGNLKDLHFFQKLPNMALEGKHVEGLEQFIVSPKTFKVSELPLMVKEGNITLLRPKYLDKTQKSIAKELLGKSLNNSFDAAAMGESKTLYNDYRLNKKLDEKTGYDYIILNNDGYPIGYVDRLHVDKNNLSTDVEINIFDSESRNKGYGKEAYQTYIKVLRQIGYISIGSVVFGFNNPSIKLHEGLKFNEYALRNESYFALGKLQDMHYYEANFEDLDYRKKLSK